MILSQQFLSAYYTNLRKLGGSIIKNPLQGNRSLKMKKMFSRIIKKPNFYPYKIQLCQELYGNDFENRTEFCMWVLDKVAENEKFFENVLFSDECTFHNNADLNGLLNQHVASIGWSSASSSLRSSAINANFKNRWIGRNGFQNWPPRSPDLTPLDLICGVHKRNCLPYASDNFARFENTHKRRF
ncbi:hypothetical protein D910_01147 [Dendroctonus ponderosae]|uniref:Uncharacterized protein n=1 Tax=Dendroctonus ponderosae TaxID=77166 RepID=U4UUB4_DENPD|nr:hypothetical protein D910_01147 [Dendroctonus ponderosae]